MSRKLHHVATDSRTTDGYTNAVTLVATTDFVNIPYDASLDIGSGSFVIAIWFKPAATTAGSHIIAQYGNSYPTGFALNQFGADLDFYVNSGPPTGTITSAFTAGNTYRIVMIGDSGTNTVFVYINGALQSTVSSVTWNITVTEPTRIGASVDIPAAAVGLYSDYVVCKGSVGGFTIPSLTNVQNDFHGTADFSGISAKFPLNEGTGTTVHASVGAASNGSLNGSATWSASFPRTLTLWCVGAAFTPPASTTTNIKIRIRVIGNMADGSSLTGIIDWRATSDGSTTALLTTKTIYSSQVDTSLTTSGTNVVTVGAQIIPIVIGIPGDKINWLTIAEYWVQ